MGGVEIAVAVFVEDENGGLVLRREVPGFSDQHGWEPQIPDRLLPGEVYYIQERTAERVVFTPLIGVEEMPADGYSPELLEYASGEEYP